MNGPMGAAIAEEVTLRCFALRLGKLLVLRVGFFVLAFWNSSFAFESLLSQSCCCCLGGDF